MSPERDDAPARLRPPSWAEQVRRVGLLELFEKYRRRMVHHKTMLPFDPSPQAPSPYTFEKLAFSTGWGLRVALKVFFPLCALGFCISLLWPDPWGLLRSCSVAGMIGFGTNWVAIKMLFWPREPRPVFGQGLIPSQRDQLIQKVADEVLEKLINEELIEQKIHETRIVHRFSDAFIGKLRDVVHTPEFKRDLRDMILGYVADLTSDPDFRARLSETAVQRLEEFAGSSFKTWLVRKLKDVWRAPLIELLNREIEGLDRTLDEGLGSLDEIVERVPAALEARQEQIDHVLTTMLMGLVREVDVRAIVLEQLSTVTTEQLEAGFLEFSDDKLSFITLLGGLLGVVGGTVLIWPLPSLAVLAALALILTLTDIAARPLMGTAYWPRKAPRTCASEADEGKATP
ncbi:MAG: DUF445 family protein [Planctomycetota bacterium]|nr:MAG: DUF445 family protein [Planctomycetota bacterium]